MADNRNWKSLLTPKQMDKLRAEEIYRQEIRQSLQPSPVKKNKIIEFLNTSLGLFILSTVFVGMISFAYSNWSAYREAESKKREKIDNLVDEANFRIDQVNRAFDNVDAARRKFKNLNAVQGKNINEYLEQAKLLTITFKLSGIYVFPLTSESNVWIGSAGYSIRHLPFQRGFKSQDFQFISLLDILKKISVIKEHSKVEADKFESLISPIDKLSDFSELAIDEDWRTRMQAQAPYNGIYSPAYSVKDSLVIDYAASLRKVDSWVGCLRKNWENILQNEDVVTNLGAVR